MFTTDFAPDIGGSCVPGSSGGREVAGPAGTKKKWQILIGRDSEGFAVRSTLGVWCCVALGAIVVAAALLAPTRGLAQGGPPAAGGLAAGAGAPPAAPPALGAAPAPGAKPPGAPPAAAAAGPSVTQRVPMIGRPLDPTLTGQVRRVVPLAKPRPVPVVVPSIGMYDNRPPLHWPSERAEERQNEARFRAACWRS